VTCRWASGSASTGAAASPPLLISDLGRPERFLNMLRVVKLQSPMSVGAWTLVTFSTGSAAAAFADMAGRLTRRTLPIQVVGNAAELVSAASGLVLATYTGVLIGATAVPVWSRNARLLPVHFGASGLGSAVCLLELLGHRERALSRIAMGAAAVETALASAGRRLWVTYEAVHGARRYTRRELVEQVRIPSTDFLDKERQHRPHGLLVEQRRERTGCDARCQLLTPVPRPIGERASDFDAIQETFSIQSIERRHQRGVRR